MATAPMPARAARRNRAGGGFTLVEVLVALTILSVIAVMAWRGLDGMVRSQQATQSYTDDVLALQAGLQQWQADLDAMAIWPQVADAWPTAERSLAWDGRALRITRTVTGDRGAGVRVVAWSRSTSDGAWRRWQSTPVRTQSAWYAAWRAAARWAESGAPETEMDGGTAVTAVTIARASDWQLHYFEDNAWTNPLSSPVGTNKDVPALPEAVRLLITLAPGQAIVGPLVMDWVRPDLG